MSYPVKCWLYSSMTHHREAKTQRSLGKTEANLIRHLHPQTTLFTPSPPRTKKGL